MADLNTPAAHAASAVADAIVDDGSPLHVGYDELSVNLLAGWRSQPDEDWMRAMLP